MKAPTRNSSMTQGEERFADLAHELRSPLGGIDAMIEMLGEMKLNPEQEKLIRGLKAASAHMRAVAQDMLSPGQRSTQGAKAGVAEVVAAFAVSARARARFKEVLFIERCGESAASAVVADGTSLRQMLENLADNAFRLTKRGSIELRIDEVEGDGGPQVRFTMVDEGPGLDAVQASAIFERRTTLPDRAAGAGLGLAIVAEMAARCGGRCGAGPRGDRQGAAVWFSLPVVGRIVKSEAPKAKMPAGPPVLVVDDDATSRTLLMTVLDHLGLDAVVCASPIDALSFIEREAVCGVLTDMSMPDMDGCDFVAALRHRFDAMGVGAVPVIAVTGRVDAADKTAMKAVGCDAIVEKPLTIHDLRQALRTTGLYDAARRVSAA